MAGEEHSELDESLSFTSENFSPEQALVSNNIITSSSGATVFNNLNKYVESLFKSESFRSLNWLPDAFLEARGRSQVLARPNEKDRHDLRIRGKLNNNTGETSNNTKPKISNEKHQEGNHDAFQKPFNIGKSEVAEIKAMPGTSTVATGMPGNVTASKEGKTKNNAYFNDRAGRLQNLMVGEVESNSREGKKGRKRLDVFERMEACQQGPLNVLYKSMHQRLRLKVWTRRYKGLRGVCIGYLIAFDKHMNLAMIDVDEIYTIEIRMLSDEEQTRIRHAKKKEKRNRYRLNKIKRNMDLLEGKCDNEREVEFKSGKESLKMKLDVRSGQVSETHSNFLQTESSSVRRKFAALKDGDCDGGQIDSRVLSQNRRLKHDEEFENEIDVCESDLPDIGSTIQPDDPAEMELASRDADSSYIGVICKKKEEEKKSIEDSIQKDQIKFGLEERSKECQPRTSKSIMFNEEDSISAVPLSFPDDKNVSESTSRKPGASNLQNSKSREPNLCSFFLCSGSSYHKPSHIKPEQVLQLSKTETKACFKENEKIQEHFASKSNLNDIAQGKSPKDLAKIASGRIEKSHENVHSSSSQNIKKKPKNRSIEYKLVKVDHSTQKTCIDVTKLLEIIGSDQCRKDPRIIKALSRQQNMKEFSHPIPISSDDMEDGTPQAVTNRGTVAALASLSHAEELLRPKYSEKAPETAQGKTECRKLTEDISLKRAISTDSQKQTTSDIKGSFAIKKIKDRLNEAAGNYAEEDSTTKRSQAAKEPGSFGAANLEKTLEANNGTLLGKSSVKSLEKNVRKNIKESPSDESSKVIGPMFDSCKTNASQCTTSNIKFTNMKDRKSSKPCLATFPTLTEHVVRRRHVNQLFIRGDNIVLVALDQ
ncbi:uncharacterized protein LOC135691609 [Rhopilema esculentum]|uniref:uncharacterized protein LOC135691609 n=1 Tax=Rhopilema esculentum TaxID=499914 RepID=UPI0031D1DD39|eukprot:gene8917-16543_t